MISYFYTDAGRVRSNNQDSVNIIENKEKQILMIVADGMGGHNDGELASRLAVDYLTAEWEKVSDLHHKNDVLVWIEENIKIANKIIHDYATDHVESRGMGTTIVLSVITKDVCVVANVGDSRGYVVKDGSLLQITNDHTLVQALVASGEITEEEALLHPKRHVLMKAVGTSNEVEADIFEVLDKQIDGIFLCSDGLTNLVETEEIEAILNSEMPIDEKVITLVEIANVKGGNDNITVAYLDLRGDK